VIADSGSSFIGESGIYDVIIKFASVAVSKNGAESVNFNVEYNGNDQTVYGPYVSDKEGNPLDIGLGLINKLAIISGMSAGDELVFEDEEHAVGKDKTVQTFKVISNFSDLPVKMRIQEEYSINPKTNTIQKRMVPRAFFREDGASAEEIINGTEAGKRLALEQEKYASNITYRDGLTEADITKWKAEAKTGKNTPAKAAPTVNKPAKSLFK
jgi:hypothetical protein